MTETCHRNNDHLFLQSSFLKMIVTKEKFSYISFYLNIELSYVTNFFSFHAMIHFPFGRTIVYF